MLMSGLIMTVSQLFLMPLLVPAIGEKKLLSIRLLMSCTNSLLLSIAWSKWIPYAATALYVLMIFVNPCEHMYKTDRSKYESTARSWTQKYAMG